MASPPPPEGGPHYNYHLTRSFSMRVHVCLAQWQPGTPQEPAEVLEIVFDALKEVATSEKVLRTRFSKVLRYHTVGEGVEHSRVESEVRVMGVLSLNGSGVVDNIVKQTVYIYET